jgi:hypothetical protein
MKTNQWTSTKQPHFTDIQYRCTVSIVDRVVSWRVRNSGLNSWWVGIFLFATTSRPALGPTQPLIQWIKQPVRHQPLTSIWISSKTSLLRVYCTLTRQLYERKVLCVQQYFRYSDFSSHCTLKTESTNVNDDTMTYIAIWRHPHRYFRQTIVLNVKKNWGYTSI